jgi:hypothetical protein
MYYPKLHSWKFRIRTTCAQGSNAETRLANLDNLHPSAVYPRRGTRRVVWG